MFDVQPLSRCEIAASVEGFVSDSVDSTLFKAARRQSRVELVISTFERLLIEKRLKPGDKIPNEFELTKSLSTSRGSVREAMKILASFGIVEIKPGDGTYVSRSMSKHLFDRLVFQMILSDADKRQLMELRELIEVGLVKILIANATDGDLAEIERRHLSMVEQVENRESDPKALTELDLAFHSAIGRAARNQLVQRIYEFTLDLFAPSMEETHKQPDRGTNALRVHQKILDALKARDQEQAVAAVEESIEQWMIRSH